MVDHNIPRNSRSIITTHVAEVNILRSAKAAFSSLSVHFIHRCLMQWLRCWSSCFLFRYTDKPVQIVTATVDSCALKAEADWLGQVSWSSGHFKRSRSAFSACNLGTVSYSLAIEQLKQHLRADVCLCTWMYKTYSESSTTRIWRHKSVRWNWHPHTDTSQRCPP